MISVCAHGCTCMIFWETAVLDGCRAAKREAQMSASSEHEFEGRVSGKLSGDIFGCSIALKIIKNKGRKSTWL